MLSDKNKQQIRHWYDTLQAQHDSFRKRPAQAVAIAEIAKTIAGSIDKQNRVLVVEAGTGTGKSLAYLIGATPLALALNKTLVISTATVALQQQLIEHELPSVHRACEGKFRFALAKGRQRYCCWHKLAQARLSGQLNPAALSQISALHRAYREGKWNGERDSWPKAIPNYVWQHIQSDALSCNNQLHRHRQCPFNQARQGLKKANVIVANHHLLLSDLLAGSGQILPPAEDCIYVLDEAHQFASITRDSASDALPLHLAINELQNLSQLESELRKGLNIIGLEGNLLKLKENCVSLSQGLKQWQHAIELQHAQFDDDGIWRFAHGKVPSLFTNLASNYLVAAKGICNALNGLSGTIQKSHGDGQLKAAIAENLLSRMGSAQLQFEAWRDCIDAYQHHNGSANHAFWFKRHEKELSVHHSPIEVGALLRDILWQNAFSVIAMSATLSALGRFDFVLSQLGLKGRLLPQQIVKLNSPFDYSRVELEVPRNTPSPDDPRFAPFVANYILRAQTAERATLVLCNSYRLVDAVKQHLNGQVENLWVQGELPNAQLLLEHKRCCDAKQSSTILASIGFAEGIDLPGDYLTELIIARLPFAVPNDPIEQSHSELLQLRQQSPFLQLTLPNASRKLVQSCGRLMRKEQDWGRIVLLDQRLSSRNYGMQLIAALPPYKRVYSDV